MMSLRVSASKFGSSSSKMPFRVSMVRNPSPEINQFKTYLGKIWGRYDFKVLKISGIVIEKLKYVIAYIVRLQIHTLKYNYKK